MHCRLIVSEHARRLSFTNDTRALSTDEFELTQLNPSMCECSQPIWPRERRVAQGRLARSVRNKPAFFDVLFLKTKTKQSFAQTGSGQTHKQR
jgi:hypothetical protein